MIGNKTSEEAIVAIVREFMALPQDQVWIRDQNRKIPADDKLYVVVGIVDGDPYASGSNVLVRPKDASTETVETSRVQVREVIQIDVMSSSVEALKSRYGVLMALNSITSKQSQEANYFKIAKLPTGFVNASEAEGGSRINRFTTTLAVLAWYNSERILSPDSNNYYDDFNTRVDDEVSIGTSEGIIEFNIKAEE